MCSSPSNEKAAEKGGPRQTIAIVDDDESVRNSLARLCKSVGFCAESYHSAEDFLAANRMEIIDCVILDYHLPGKNGLELLHEILAHDGHMPVVMVTGEENQEIRDRAIENGAVASLSKLMDSNHLVDVVRWAMRIDRGE